MFISIYIYIYPKEYCIDALELVLTRVSILPYDDVDIVLTIDTRSHKRKRVHQYIIMYRCRWLNSLLSTSTRIKRLLLSNSSSLTLFFFFIPSFYILFSLRHTRDLKTLGAHTMMSSRSLGLRLRLFLRTNSRSRFTFMV